MPTPPDPEWTLLESVVNGQGNLLTLSFQVKTYSAAFEDTDSINLEDSTNSVNTSLIGSVSGWRFNSVTGQLTTTVSGDPISEVDVFDAEVPVHVSGSIYTVNFKVGIQFSARNLIAINNATDAVEIDTLEAAWMTLIWHHAPGHPTTPPDMPSPEFDGDAGLKPDTTPVGKLPNPSTPSLPLMVSVDAHAEGVAQEGSVAHLTIWHGLSGTDDLIGEPEDGEPSLTAGDPAVPHVDFDGETPNLFRSGETTPAITTPATVAAVLIPDTEESPTHIVGRYNDGGPSWRIYYSASAIPENRVGYQAVGPGGTDTVEFDVDQFPATVLFILRRHDDEGKTWEAWINGVPVGADEFTTTVNSGSGDLTVGAKRTTGDPDQGFTGQINQVGLYNTDIDDLTLSLLMHQMASRAIRSVPGGNTAPIDLGTPIPSAWQFQPFNAEANASLPPERALARRPMAVINLASGNRKNNIFGQALDWRDPDTNEPNVEALKEAIRKALNGCDEYEIVFNRPGGTYATDGLVMSYVFGTASNGDTVITTDQWDGMRELWDYFNLSDFNDDQDKNANHWKKRRGWMYVGAGMPIHDGGEFDDTGLMHSRQVAPATPSIYKTSILDHWPAADNAGDPSSGRYRCLFLDNGIAIFGKFVELVHDEDVFANYTLISEAVPQNDETNWPDQHAARLAAPWFGMAGTPRGPWWNVTDDTDEPDHTNIRAGYNYTWTTQWETSTTYFGIQYADGEVLDLYTYDFDAPTAVGSGNDLKLGDIYNWIRRDAIPISWSSNTHQKVGTAWNYATGRVMPSRLLRCPRLLRSARC